MSYIKNENFVKAIRYIYDNIDTSLRIEDIANTMGVSASTLKRIFTDAVNQNPGQLIRRLRMEFAFRSLRNRNDSILEVALGVGFDDQSAFARSFKAVFGYAPKEARAKHNILSELEAIELDEPDIIEIDGFECQSVTEQGLYFECAPKAWNVLKSRLPENVKDDNFTGVFIGIGHDNPHGDNVNERKGKFTAGVMFYADDLGLSRTVISAGRYARFHFKGKLNNLGIAYHYIYGRWLMAEKEKIAEKQAAFIVFSHFPDAMHEQNVLIHVPLEQNEEYRS